MRKAIFLDRDGTINELVNWQLFVDNVSDVKLKKWVKNTLKKLKNKWYLLIVITNQTWVWAGFYKKEDAILVNQEIERQLWFNFNKIYSCYHHPDDNCNCRKPNIWNFEKAIKKFNVDVKLSYMIWDKEKDIIAWKRIWVKTILLSSNKNIDTISDFVIKDFDEILEIID